MGGEIGRGEKEMRERGDLGRGERFKEMGRSMGERGKRRAWRVRDERRVVKWQNRKVIEKNVKEEKG